MPYRIDVPGAAASVLERLIELGALDVEGDDAGVAALMPDSVGQEEVANALGANRVVFSAAIGRDADSVWVLNPRPVQAGGVRIVPAERDAEPGTLRMIDTPAFGTGLHPTTALCLEMLDDIVQSERPDSVLDVGTGSGVLALAALVLGVAHATAVDIDGDALRAAGINAERNGLAARLRLAKGGPEAVSGTWPLVLANVLAAPLIEMAPALVRRLGHYGLLVLSGIPSGIEGDVGRVYRHLGMRDVRARSRAGWIALVLRATW